MPPGAEVLWDGGDVQIVSRRGKKHLVVRNSQEKIAAPPRTGSAVSEKKSDRTTTRCRCCKCHEDTSHTKRSSGEKTAPASSQRPTSTKISVPASSTPTARAPVRARLKASIEVSVAGDVSPNLQSSAIDDCAGPAVARWIDCVGKTATEQLSQMVSGAKKEGSRGSAPKESKITPSTTAVPSEKKVDQAATKTIKAKLFLRMQEGDKKIDSHGGEGATDKRQREAAKPEAAPVSATRLLRRRWHCRRSSAEGVFDSDSHASPKYLLIDECDGPDILKWLQSVSATPAGQRRVLASLAKAEKQ